MPLGFAPVAIVAGERAVSAPVEVLRLYIETVLLPLFATYTDVPSSDTVMPNGCDAASTVAGERAVSMPVEVLRLYCETVLLP